MKTDKSDLCSTCLRMLARRLSMEASKWACLEISAHHFMAEEDAERREHVRQAIIRYFGETTGRSESLDLTAIDASNLHGNVRERRHLCEAGFGRSAID